MRVDEVSVLFIDLHYYPAYLDYYWNLNMNFPVQYHILDRDKYSHPLLYVSTLANLPFFDINILKKINKIKQSTRSIFTS